MSRKTRKLIWSAPLVAVLAVAAALAIFAAQTPGDAQADHVNIPSAPTNLVAKPADGNEGRTAVVLTWLAPERGPVTGYRIDYSMNGSVWMQLEDNTGDAKLMYKHEDLKPGLTYIYRVFAINNAGTGLVSETYSTVTTGAAGQPDRVMNVRATVPTTIPEKWHQIDLTWDAPYGGGKKITGYCIEMSDEATPFQGDTEGCRAATTPTADVTFATGSAAGLILTGNAMTKHSVKELLAAERRFFKVYAITGAGTTADPYGVSEMPSATVNAMTASSVNPSPPRNLRLAKNADGTVVNLYWHWPASDGGVAIDNFRVEVTSDRNKWPLASHENADNGWVGSGITATVNDEAVLTDVTAAVAQSSTTAEQSSHTHAVTVQKTLYYRVFTKSGTKKSVASNIASIVVNGGTNPTPPTFAATGAVPADEDAGRTKINLEWTAGLYDDPNDSPDAGATVPYPAAGYRIDYAMGAATGDDLLKWMPLWGHTGFTDTKFNHEGIKPSTEIYYRIFTIGARQTISTASDLQSATTKDPGALAKVRNLKARAVDSTKISVTWDHPTGLGDSDIDHYSVQMAQQGAIPANFADIVTEQTDGPALMYEHTDLSQNQVWLYRVAAVAPDRDAAPEVGEYTGWATATTPAAGKPEMPIGLVAENARDSNLTGPGQRGVLLIWDKPMGPPGSMIVNYKVERMVIGEDSTYKALGTTTNMRTTLTDFDEPATDEVRMYRVAAIDDGDVTGEWAEVRFPVDVMMKPSAPQRVMAAKSTDMPASAIKVSWSAPEMNADDVTGYIIERKYDGDMVGDIPSDGYNTDVMGAMHAFKDYKEWWETLNCKGMLAVAMAEDNEANRGMYCKHFLDTYPTKIADNADNADKKISDETAMKVKELFMKRYVTKSDDMGMTKTMFTGMMHYDTGLMANTKYTYRVRAIHGMKAGPWSAAAMATTDSAVTGLTAPTEVKATVSREGGDPGNPANVTVTWKDGQGASQHAVILFDSDFDFDPATDLKTGQTDGTTTFMNVPAGDYTAVVVALDDDFEMKIGFDTVTVQ